MHEYDFAAQQISIDAGKRFPDSLRSSIVPGMRKTGIATNQFQDISHPCATGLGIRNKSDLWMLIHDGQVLVGAGNCSAFLSPQLESYLEKYNSPPMRVLLVKTSSLGDVIHALPVASDIRRALPHADIDWVVEENFTEIPRFHPAIGAVIPVAMRRWRKTLFTASTWRELAAFRRAVRQADYDAIIDLQGLVKSAVLVAQTRGKKSGHARPREALAALAYDVAVDVARNQNAVLRNRQLVAAALGYALDGLPLDYGIAASPLKAGWLPPGEYAVLLTATSRADKEWPEANWRTLGTALIATGLRCVLPGGSEPERLRAARIVRSLGRAVAAPAMQLSELAGLLAGARIVIGVDTGLVHLAAALGHPTVAIYCASDPTLTGVLADTPHANLGAYGNPPTADETIAIALRLLDA